MTRLEKDFEEALEELAGQRLADGKHPGTERLVAYQEGRLDAADREAVADHVAACRRCADTLLDLQAFQREAAAGRPPEEALPAGADAGPGGDPEEGREERRGRLLRFPPRAGWALVAAAASLVAVVLLVDRQPPALPAWEATLAGGAASSRGQAPGPTFPPGSHLELVLRPEVPYEGALQVRTLLARGGEVVPWEAPVEIAERGVVVIEGTVGEDVDLPPGTSTLLVALGRPDALPAAEELAGLLAAGGDGSAAGASGWTLVRVPVKVTDPRTLVSDPG